MSIVDGSGTFTLGSRKVKRLGYGAMQLAGPGVFGPPKDHRAAVTILPDDALAALNGIASTFDTA